MFCRAIVRGATDFASRPGIPMSTVELRNRNCEKFVFAAVLQLLTESDEITCVRSTPKCAFLGNGDVSSCASDGRTSTRKLKILAVLGNHAVFQSAQAQHHRNSRPPQSRFVANLRSSRTALRFWSVIFFDLGFNSADKSAEPPCANTLRQGNRRSSAVSAVRCGAPAADTPLPRQPHRNRPAARARQHPRSGSR